MQRICDHCGQAIPETPEEKALAEEKKLAAQKAWERFHTPKHTFFTKHVGVTIMIGAICFFATFYFMARANHLIDGYTALKTFGVAFAVYFIVSYFLTLRPLGKIEKQNKKAKKNFIEERPLEAGVLGFTTE